MIDWTKPIRTKGGRAARVICTDRITTAECSKSIVLVMSGSGVEGISEYYSNGTYYNSGDSEYDLENVPEKKKIWINVFYKKVHGVHAADGYSSKEYAFEGYNSKEYALEKIALWSQSGWKFIEVIEREYDVPSTNP